MQIVVHVHQDRHTAGQENRAGRSREGERRTSHPIAGTQPRPHQPEGDGRRAARARQCIGHIESAGQLQFQLAGLGLLVAPRVVAKETAAAQGARYRCLIVGIEQRIALVIGRPRSGAHRRTAVHGESLGRRAHEPPPNELDRKGRARRDDATRTHMPSLKTEVPRLRRELATTPSD